MKEAVSGAMQKLTRWPGKRPRIYLIGLALLLGMVAVACQAPYGRGAYPLDFFYEMHYMQWHKAQEPPRLDAPETAVAWFPPAGPTIPFASEGRHLYEVNCSMCHGLEGRGDGPVLRTMIDRYGYQPAVTPDLTAEQVRALGVAGIESFMVAGVVAMPSFARLLTPEEMRAIAEYVTTTLQQ